MGFYAPSGPAGPLLCSATASTSDLPDAVPCRSAVRPSRDAPRLESSRAASRPAQGPGLAHKKALSPTDMLPSEQSARTRLVPRRRQGNPGAINFGCPFCALPPCFRLVGPCSEITLGGAGWGREQAGCTERGAAPSSPGPGLEAQGAVPGERSLKGTPCPDLSCPTKRRSTADQVR